MTDKLVDVKGLKCPMPIVRISRELKKLNSDQTLEITSDDPAFGEDVKAFCRVSGNKLESLNNQEGIFIAVIGVV